MSNRWGVFAAVSGLLCVALGAFGAHGLKAMVAPDLLATWHTGVSYQFYHTLVLLLLALSPVAVHGGCLNGSRWAFTVGIVLFSGSLYVLVLSGERWLGMVAPVGGLSFMVGWAVLAAGLWRGASRDVR
jgi:uncharacterized membrane protein YgdD (TMEM256/DUF423 family)